MVSKKICFFNLLVLIKLVQIVKYSPYGNEFSLEMPNSDLESKLPAQIASIALKTGPYEQDFLCNGYIISSDAILAPQNCIYNKSSWLPYKAEDINVETSSMRNISISKISHQKIFQKDGFALLFLNDEIQDVSTVQLHGNKIQDGAIVQLVNMDGLKMNSLKSTYTKVVDISNCGPLERNDRQICVSGDSTNSNRALFINGKLAGLRHESWKRESSGSELFKLYSNISHHHSWIGNEIKRSPKSDSAMIGICGFIGFTILAVGMPKRKGY